MKSFFNIVFLFLALLAYSLSSAQPNRLDSLSKVLAGSKADTNKVNLLNQICYEYYITGDYEKEMKCAQDALVLSKKLNWKKGIGSSYISIGGAYDDLGKYHDALENYDRAAEIFKKIIDEGNSEQLISAKKGLASCYNNSGLIHNYKGNYPEALEFFFRALKIREEIKDNAGKSMILNNLGMVYERQGKFEESLKNYEESLKLKIKIGDKHGIAITNNNIGNLYTNYKKYDLAIEKHQISLKTRAEFGDKRGMSDSYSNIGNILYDLGNYKAALENHEQSMKLREQIGDKSGLANTYTQIGKIHLKMNDARKGRVWVEKGMILAKQTGVKDWIKNAYFELFRIDSALGNHKASLEDYKMFIIYKDSLYNENSARKSLEASMNYEFEKKQARAAAEQEKKDAIEKAEQAKKDEVNEEEKKRQQIVIILVSCLLIIALVAAYFIFQNLKTTRKQKIIIEEQKQIVEEKHKEITDSINYAERIQRSFLATNEILDKNLENHFVLFQPKEAVSGDFYWANELPNDHFLLACADSTGHGVPGAIMSILNISSLEKAVEDETDPANILNRTRQLIIDRLKKDGSPEGGKDGMDCSLVCFDFKSAKIHFALANNPLWVFRRSTDNSKKVIEFKPDKMPVGKHEKQDIPFTSKQFDLEKGDLIVLFTDGYADQFGGDKGKKFKYANLQKLILEKSELPVNSIKMELEKKLKEWKGDLEQVDDVCIIGIKI